MRRIRIFDTTLRDGEQSPGASMNIEEKLEVARQLARLKVDVIEAGFPISSPGDFEAVKAIAETVKGPLSRASAARTSSTSTARGRRFGSRRSRSYTLSSRPPTSTSKRSSRRPVTKCSISPSPQSSARKGIARTWSSPRRIHRGPTSTICARWSKRSSTPARRS